MSQLYIRNSKLIVQEESCSSSVSTLSWDLESSTDLSKSRRGNGEYAIQCLLPGAMFLKQILLPINPSLGGRNPSMRMNASDISSSQLKNLFYIHLVFHSNYMMVQSMMSGQSMYTCVRVPRSRFNRYSITAKDGSPYRHTVDIAIPLHTLIVCLNMYQQNQEIEFGYDSDDRHIVIMGKCANYSEYRNTHEVDQLMICRLKTINMPPLQMPFSVSDFKFIGVDYFSISPKILYPCLHDIASDSSSSKLVMEVLPRDECQSNIVLALARGKTTLALEWDFAYDATVFDEFNVSNSHRHRYSTRCWLSVANGIKLARKIRIAVKNDGILLIQVSIFDHMSDGINFYYYMHPLLETV